MSEQPNSPSDLHPALTNRRLQFIADLITEARRQSVRSFDPSQGDNAWSLGCVAYVRTCYAIQQAALRLNNWLRILDRNGLRFVFSIGGVPLRFYRGDPDSPPGRYREVLSEEIQAKQLAFEFMKQPAFRGALRFAVETSGDGEVSAIYLIQVDSEERIRGTWTIMRSAVPQVASIDQRKEPAQLPPPSVGTATKKAEQADSE